MLILKVQEMILWDIIWIYSNKVLEEQLMLLSFKKFPQNFI